MKATERDKQYMAMALRLAAKGRGLTSPNPMVGAVLVAHGTVIGSGYHRQAGGPHAEVHALQRAGRKAGGATLYVTLEPCCHTRKRTPPCVPAILAAGLRRVVIAMLDPNAQVAGRGVRLLRRAGVRVTVGCQKEEAEHLNESYCHWVRTGRPFVVLKAAMTLDGKLATAGGESQWITGEAARRQVHLLRSRMDAVMVGIGTVLKDDPKLTVRLDGRTPIPGKIRQPLRVVLDSRLQIPLKAIVLARVPRTTTGHAEIAKTLVATTKKAPKHRLERLRSLGVPVLVLPERKGSVSLHACFTQLGKRGVTTLMLEGGSYLNGSALRAGLVNRVVLFIAPSLLGGQESISVIGGPSPKRLADAFAVTGMQAHRVGNDLLIEGTLSPPGTMTRRDRPWKK